MRIIPRLSIGGCLAAALGVSSLALVSPMIATQSASAATTVCSTSVPIAAGNSCTAVGTATLAGGLLTMAETPTLTWAGTLSSANSTIVDALPTDQQILVVDATGTQAGWKVTASATQFTNTVASNSLANTGTLVLTGSTTSIAGTTAPTGACTAGATCTVPNNTATYPVAITTAATNPTAATIYDTAANSGVGAITIGGATAANPVGWWLNVPATTTAGVYTSTVTLTITSGP